MSSKSKFVTHKSEGLVTIACEGELSLYVAPELRSLLADAVASGDEIAVDLTRALFIDSAILMALVAVGRDLPSVGRKLKVVVSDNSHPQYVLKVSGMNELFDVIVAQE